MPASSDRLEFAPPPPPGMLRAFMLAIAAHIMLMLALTWGVSWKREAENISAEAELWSATPQQAAPKPIPPPPPPPAPAPAPEPVVKAAPPPPPPMPSQADIALEREKKKQAELKQQQEEAKKAEELKKRQLAQKAAEDRKQQLAQKAAEDRKKADAAKATQNARQLDEMRRLEAQRKENLDRMQGLAGATGAPTATGNAQRSSGPSDSYGGRIRAKVKPNIVFGDDVPGNPTTEVEVRMAPDGTITGTRILKSSGVKPWDDAVVRALLRTEVLPRDLDGRVHSPLVIEFRPKS